MKFIHLSDLHLGKRLNELPLLDDQRDILDKILAIVDTEEPDAVLIAGDVYDRSNPPAEAVSMFDDFLTALAERRTQVLIISGNHDAAERVAYGGRLLCSRGVHVSPVYDGHIEPVVLHDKWGEVRFYLMPYIHPEAVRAFFPETQIESFQDAACAVVAEMRADAQARNVLLAHQFVIGGQTSDSERRSIGTLDHVDAAVFSAFDYVALGHLHSPQNVGRTDGTMRYCGTPLKYSLSEQAADKSVTVVEMGGKGDVQMHAVPLVPLHEMRKVRGAFDELLAKGPAQGQEQDYYYVTLTDEVEIPHAAPRLRERFPQLMSLEYDNRRTRELTLPQAGEAPEARSPLELLDELYARQHNGTAMNDETRALAVRMMQQIEGWQV